MEEKTFKQGGWIEVICGGMFSGKSEELIRRIRRAKIARLNVVAFKPALDNRYHEQAIASHNGLIAEAMPITNSPDILDNIPPDTNVVAIDEIQFFDHDLISICQELADRGLRVICAGLDQDFRAQAFGPTPFLLAIAEYITKLQAICIQCGLPASRTQRLVGGSPASANDPIIQIAAVEQYEARCRFCHQLDGYD